jgi:hypothetical protein
MTVRESNQVLCKSYAYSSTSLRGHVTSSSSSDLHIGLQLVIFHEIIYNNFYPSSPIYRKTSVLGVGASEVDFAVFEVRHSIIVAVMISRKQRSEIILRLKESLWKIITK